MFRRLIDYMVLLPMEAVLFLIEDYPGRAGFTLRRIYWRYRLKHLGKNVKIDTGVYFQHPECVELDDNCWIDKNVIILAGMDSSHREKRVEKTKSMKVVPGVVHIGKNVHIGPGVVISGIAAGVYISDNCGLSAGSKVYAFSHHYRSRRHPGNDKICFTPLAPHDQQCLIEGAVYIGENTGIALNAVILPGAVIEGKCFVAINSVVHSGTYSSNSIISGNPAAIVANRFVPTED